MTQHESWRTRAGEVFNQRRARTTNTCHLFQELLYIQGSYVMFTSNVLLKALENAFSFAWLE